MIYEIIKNLREDAGYSQSKLAKMLGISRSAVNAWEMGTSVPTTQYIVELARLFHVSTDYLLELEPERTIILKGYTLQELNLVYDLLKYIDSKKENCS